MLHKSSDIRTDTRDAQVPQAAFFIGAVAAAGAILPMLLPSLATTLWGLFDVSGSYRVFMACAASLMLGWTLLLVWASTRPLERRFVAPLTILVVGGIVATVVAGAAADVLDAWGLIPTWCLQATLLILFAWACHTSDVQHRAFFKAAP